MMPSSVVLLGEAEKGDTLQEIFGESILKECLVCDYTIMTCCSSMYPCRNNYPAGELDDLSFDRICTILNDVCKLLDCATDCGA